MKKPRAGNGSFFESQVLSRRRYCGKGAVNELALLKSREKEMTDIKVAPAKFDFVKIAFDKSTINERAISKGRVPKCEMIKIASLKSLFFKR